METPQYRSLFGHLYSVEQSDGNDFTLVDTAYLHDEEISKYLTGSLGEDCEIDESQEFSITGTYYEPVDEDDDLQDTPHTSLTLDFIRAHYDCTPRSLSQVLRYMLDCECQLLAYCLARVRWSEMTHPEYTHGALLQAHEYFNRVSQLLSLTYTMMHVLGWFSRWACDRLETWLTQFDFDVLTAGDKMREKFVFQLEEVIVPSGKALSKTVPSEGTSGSDSESQCPEQ